MKVTLMVFNGEDIRKDFPALTHGYAFFDAPGGTQIPQAVADRVRETSLMPISYRSLGSVPGQNANDAVLAFRAAAADLLGGSADGIVHGRSATQLTFDFSRSLSKTWAPGDNIVLSRLDHDSNVAPWLIAAERRQVEVRWAEFDPETSELAVRQYEDLVDSRTRVVAVTGASNLIGTQPDIAGIARIAHFAGALVYVDGVHNTAHSAVDVRALGADFYVCSPYKLFGPHCAFLAAAPQLLEEVVPDKLRPSPNNVPERFELGTLPYELLAGTTAMVDYVASLAPAGTQGDRRQRVVAAMGAIDEYELQLRQQLEAGLMNLDRVALHSRAEKRTSTLLISVEGLAPLAVEERLREHGVLSQAGNFYAIEACTRMGLGEAGGLRFGLAPYNTAAEVEHLLNSLEQVVKP